MSTEILIIDDNSDIRIILDELIKEAGYKTRLAANFNQALSEIDKKLPDVAIIDVKLDKSDNDGIEFFSPIKNANVRFNFQSRLSSNLLALDITHPDQPRTIEIIDNQKLEVALAGEYTGRFIIVNRSEILAIDEINYELSKSY